MELEEVKTFMQEIPYIQYMGIVIDEVLPDSARLHVDMRSELCNPYGMAHGGVLFTLLDTVAGATARADGRPYVTLNANINYLHSTYRGRLTAQGRIVKRGSEITVVDVNVTGEEERILASGTVTMFCLAGRQEKNSSGDAVAGSQHKCLRGEEHG